MGSWGAGLLAAVSGAGEGLGKAMGNQAREKRKETVDAAKARALEEKQKNLLFLQNELAGQRQDRQNAFKVGQQGSGRFDGGHELTNAEFGALPESGRKGLLSTAEYEQSLADRKFGEAKKVADYQHGLGMQRDSHKAGLKTTSKTDLEQKYNFLANTFGEEKAKEMISASLVKKSGGDTALDYRKLWNDAYNKKLKILTEDMSDQRTLTEKEADARAMADQVAGVSLGGGQGGVVPGSLADRVARINSQKKEPQKPMPKTEDGSQQSAQGSRGLLSMDPSTPIAESRKIENAAGFKTSMDSIAENSGMNASANVQNAIKLTRGQYNPTDGSIQFKPKDESDLKAILVELKKQGIEFGAERGSNGEIILRITERQRFVN